MMTVEEFKRLRNGKLKTVKSSAQKTIDREKRKANKDRAQKIEAEFFNQLSKQKIPLPEKEYMFHHTRRWRMDYAWVKLKVFVEQEGGIYSNGRHVRPQGFLEDKEKYNAAAEKGWLLLRYTPSEIFSFNTIQQIKSTLNGRLSHVS